MKNIKDAVIIGVGLLAPLVLLVGLVLYAQGRPSAIRMMVPLDFLFILPAGLIAITRDRASLPRHSDWLAAAAAGIFIQRLFLFVLPDDLISVSMSFAFGAAGAYLLKIAFRMKKEIKKDIRTLEDSPGNLPLTFDAEGVHYITTEACNYHIQIIGGTGSGKTHFVIKPFIRQDIIKNKIGCFIYDVKSNMANDVAYYVKEAGRERDYKYFDLAHPELSMTYNPLFGGEPTEIANRVFTALYFENDPNSRHYYEIASAFLNNLISLLMKDIPILTFEDISRTTNEIDTFKTIARYCQKYPDTPQAQYFKGNWLSKNAKQRQEELSGLANKLQRFCTREWAPLINTTKPDITMKEVVTNDQILHFGVAASKYTDDAKPLAILAITDLFGQASPRFEKKPEKPFRIYLDEFYDIAYPGFVKMVNKCRDAKMDWVLSHQSMGDLKSVSDEFMEQVSINTRNKVILAIDDPDSAEFLARLFGTEKDEVKVFSYDTRESTFLGGAKAAGYTVPIQDKFRFHPNDIKEMPLGTALVRTIQKRGPVIFKTELFPAPPVPDSFDPRDVIRVRNNHKKPNEFSIKEKDVSPTARPVEEGNGSALDDFARKLEGEVKNVKKRIRRK